MAEIKKDNRTVQELAQSKSGFYDVLYRSEKQLGMPVIDALFRCTSLSELKTFLDTLRSDEFGKNIMFVSERNNYYDADDLLKAIVRFENKNTIQDVPKILLEDQNLRDKVLELKVAEKNEEVKKIRERDRMILLEKQRQNERALKDLFELQSFSDIINFLRTQSNINNSIRYKSQSSEYSPSELYVQLSRFDADGDVTYIPSISYNGITLKDRIKQIESLG